MKTADKTNSKKLFVQAKLIDIQAGKKIVVLNTDFAKQNDIHQGQRVGIKLKNEEYTMIVDLSSELVTSEEIGIFSDTAKELGIKASDLMEVFVVPTPMSIEAIRKKIFGEELSKEEIYSVIEDLMDNRLSEPEIASFIVSAQIRGLGDKEVVSLIEAMVASGEIIQLGKHPVVDKHCIGGVAGNRTTTILVPIVAALGLYIPKTSSKAITSPAGTADTMEVFANVNFKAEELKEIVLKTKGAIVWGGGVNIAPADDHMIAIRRSLRLDPRGVLMSSILAKKKAVSSEYVIVDIPVGRGSKMEDLASAKSLGEYFKKIGTMIGINVGVVLTEGSSPIGFGIGPALEARDILRVLKNDANAPRDLSEKSALLAGKLLELCGKVSSGDGYDVAAHFLKTGKAWSKMQEIIEAQGGNPNIKEDDLPIGKYTYELKAPKDGKIEFIDNKLISKLARHAGAPSDKGAGLELWKTTGDKVKSGETLLKIYAESESKLSYALKSLENYKPITMERVLIEEMF